MCIGHVDRMPQVARRVLTRVDFVPALHDLPELGAGILQAEGGGPPGQDAQTVPGAIPDVRPVPGIWEPKVRTGVREGCTGVQDTEDLGGALVSVAGSCRPPLGPLPARFARTGWRPTPPGMLPWRAPQDGGPVQGADRVRRRRRGHPTYRRRGSGGPAPDRSGSPRGPADRCGPPHSRS